MSAERSVGEPVLVLVSPTALALDGESVRVARDVLGAALAMKAVVPESLLDLERLLARRGRRRPVVIGDDRSLRQVVQLLHQQATLAAAPVGMIPVGRGHGVELARALGAETRPVQAARAIVNGADRRLDLLVDEDGGVVLGAVHIPGGRSPRANKVASAWWTGISRRVTHALAPPADREPTPPPLRVEADGQVLADPTHPMRALALRSASGSAELRINARRGRGAPMMVQAQRVTVGGRLFTYEADHALSAPVHERTWTVEPSAWSLRVPA
ncbi:diacylglycerol kinase family protein [Streptacidiphilus rugosus]|uniref:diacylglycerol kinase family protein n=1 Tax=Streptacidiphilus rugosus TaxID=405783 RepID=UPI0007C6E872|nr:diacylglycerol kinase family protein [Streptacidiphilus rugosus]